MAKRDYLVALRKKNGWTQKFIAEKLGVTANYYGMIEKGIRTPGLSTALEMQELFGLPVDRLFCDLIKPNKEFSDKSKII